MIGARTTRPALMRAARWIAGLLLLAVTAATGFARDDDRSRTLGTVAIFDLPKEAQQTLALVRAGGPFPYPKDGVVFGNFERRLPAHERGYYHEYTVRTPGAKDRGARRIVAGKHGEFFYTADHYNTFRRIKE